MLVPTLASQLRVISQWIFSPYTASTRISSELNRLKTSERILFPVSTVQKLPHFLIGTSNQSTDRSSLPFIVVGRNIPACQTG